MRIVVWVLAAIVLAMATVTVGVLTSAVDWLATSGDKVARGAASAGDVIASLELPRWLAWLDPNWLKPLQDVLMWGVTLLAHAGPWIGPALGWVSPLLWVGWAMFAIVVLALAGVLHHLAGRMRSEG